MTEKPKDYGNIISRIDEAEKWRDSNFKDRWQKYYKMYRSIEYADRLIKLGKAEKEDFLNLGHALAANQQIPVALTSYRKALTQYSNFGFFKKDFLHDRKFLLQHLPPETVYFLLDCLLQKRV